MASASEKDDTDQETDQEQEKEEDEGPQLPEMTLYRLDWDKIISKRTEIVDNESDDCVDLTRSISKSSDIVDDETDDDKFAIGKNVCSDIIKWYNSKDENTSSEEDKTANCGQTQHPKDDASESYSQGSTLDSVDTDDSIHEEEERYEKFEYDKEVSKSLVVGYRQKKTRKNELVQALSKLRFTESDSEASTYTISVILFVITGDKESPSIYALTTNQARFVIGDFCDDYFSTKIAKCGIDPNVKTTGKRHLVGSTYASSYLYRQDGIPIHISGNDFVSSLKSRFRGDSKIVKLNKSLQLKSKKEARVNVTRKSVHICKRQTMKQIVGVIEEMEALMIGDDEEHPKMACLDDIKLVKDKNLKSKLEDELIKKIWNDILERRGGKEISEKASTLQGQDSGYINEDTSIDTEERRGDKHRTSAQENMTSHIDFCYTDYELYYRGSDFEVVNKKKKGITWKEPKSYEEVLEDLEEIFKNEKKFESFAESIKKTKLKFQTESHNGPIKVTSNMMDFFHGECRYLKDESCYRNNGKWFKDKDNKCPVVKQAEKKKLEDALITKIWTDIRKKREGSERQEEGDDTAMEDSGNYSNIPQSIAEDSSSTQQHCENPTNAVEDNSTINIKFCYHNQDEYNEGHNFQIKRKNGDVIRKSHNPISYDEVLEEFETFFKNRKQLANEINNMKQLATEINNMKLTFKCKGKPARQLNLMKFFQCTLHRRKLEIYYKIDGDWSKFHQRFIHQVHTKFQYLLRQILVDKESAMYLNEPWKKDLYKKFSKADFERITGTGQLAEKIWERFEKMELVKKDKVKRSSLEEKIPQLSDSDKDIVRSFISKTKIEGSMDESNYNEIFSYKDTKETANEGEWYVGDRILPNNIEIFDIMKVDKDRTNLYLYHVKEEFGNKTRDACSQIRVSALAIHNARCANDEQDILGKFYDLAVQYKTNKPYRIEEKKKLLNRYTKEEFKDLFKTRRITYVYAFLDTHPDEASMSDERDRKLEKKSRFESNIARLELLHLNPFIEGLGFHLAISQIERSDPNQPAPKVKKEESDMDVDQQHDSMEVDSSSTPPYSPLLQMEGGTQSPERKKAKN